MSEPTAAPTLRPPTSPLLVIVAVALALRVAFVVAVLSTHGAADLLRLNGDTVEYHKLAAGLAGTGRYGAGGVEMNVIGLVRVPLYPLLYAALLKTVGGKAAIGGLFLLQAAGDALLAGLAGLLAWRLWQNRTAALLAAGLLALDATGVGLSAAVLTDGPFALLVCGGVLLLLRAARTNRPWPAAACGLTLAAATLTKPTPLLLPLVLPPLWWLAAGGSDVKWQVSLRNLALCLALFVLPVAAWAVRNKVQTNVLAVSTVTDRNLRFMIGPEAEMRSAANGGRVAGELVWERYRQLAHADAAWLDQPGMTAAEFVRLQREYNGLLLRSFPAAAVRVYLADLEINVVGHWDILFRQLPVAGTAGVDREGFAPATGYAKAVRAALWPLFAAGEVKLLRWAFVALMLLAVAAAWAGKSPHRRPASVVGLVVLYLVLTAATTHSQGSRILYPAHAPVVALACGLPGLVGAFRRRRDDVR